METRDDTTRRATVIHPSMGPPPFSDGNQGQAEHHVFVLSPSMGPPPFSDGNVQGGLEGDPPGDPSMGPPPFSDGNALTNTRAYTTWSILQWGHRLSAMETLWVAPTRVTESTLQWGHRLSAMETPQSPAARWLSRCSFNGATAFQRWKRALPSTLPRSPCPFNGATAFQQWKHVSGDAGLGGMEAFNGATAFQRWKLRSPSRMAPAFALLQWGHRLSAMETRTARSASQSGRSPFNGATAFQRWKLGVRHVPIGEKVPSMGPPPFSDGNLLRPH